MKKKIFYLMPTPEDQVQECCNVITWLTWIAYDAIANPDLIVLTEQFYFSN